MPSWHCLALLLVLPAGCSRPPLPGDPTVEPVDPGDLVALADLRPPGDLRPVHDPDLTVVMPAAPRGFYTGVTNGASVAFTTGPSPAPLALGGVQLRTGPGTGVEQGGRAALSTGRLTGVPLADVTALRYAAYVQPAATSAARLAPSLSLHLDLDGDGRRDTTAVFEPSLSPDQGGVRRGVWQTWDARAGRFWLAVATPAFCAGTCYATLPQLLAAHRGAAVVDWGSQPGLQLYAGDRDGGPWAGFDGALDEIELGVRGQTARFDLEPDAAACDGQGYTASQRPLYWDRAHCVQYHR